MGRDRDVEDVRIPKSTDGHGRTVEFAADHVLKVDLEDRKGIQSYHGDRNVLGNQHQCNSVQDDDDGADYMAVCE